MNNYFAGDIDIAVIGAGHAGVEAALASSRLGAKTVIFTIQLDSIANLPCNPSIGGTAKGHLVREIDALGGEMGRAADATYIQNRMLNRGKGPAVYSLRAQIDRKEYMAYMKRILEKQRNLTIKQAEITDIEKKDDIWVVTSGLGAVYHAKAVIIATGTYLGGKIFVGDVSYESGPDGLAAATKLSYSLSKKGLSLRRFKTGTPARVHRNSVNFAKLEEQPGDLKITPFSLLTENPMQNRAICHITWTNERTKKIIKDNIHTSPMYSGRIEGIGTRYCPSIEDKIMRFPDKERHQVFIEPCGLDTAELYLQGVSSSLPESVQMQMYRTIKGLENAEIMRTAYAIEYDCIDPLSLTPTLEIMGHEGLYGAGQFNGSSGYEEAAAQGLVAGINAARKIQGKEQIVFPRSNSYIGTLIDDLVTKGCSDPYRMMTSRSEYRLVLRQDNAEERLTPIGRKIGLVSDEYWNKFKSHAEMKKNEIKRAKMTVIKATDELNKMLVSRGTSEIEQSQKLITLLLRPELNYEVLKPFDPKHPDYPDCIFEQVEVEIKYEGYIKRQNAQIKESARLEQKLLPDNTNYIAMHGLRAEAAEKLAKIRPVNIGQASRISGVTPADISVLLIYLERIK